VWPGVKMARPNCWDFMACSRGPDCSQSPCPAATDRNSDGVNGGFNGGRFCWAVAGTYCGGETHCAHATEHDSCFDCEFFKLVKSQEGPGAVVLLKTAKWWEDI
jgi:hypothetical protein